MNKFEDKTLDEKIRIIEETDDLTQLGKGSRKDLVIKIMILLPSVLFIIGFFFFNANLVILDILKLLILAALLIILGVILFLIQ